MGSAGSLLQSYLTTRYEVYGSTPRERFTLRIGQREPKLAALHARKRVRCSAFITAWHPRSIVRAPSLNRVAQAKLLRDLRLLGCIVVPGQGIGTDGQWREPSVLALGLRRMDAKRLALRYGQNAAVVCDIRAIPQLLLVRPLPGAASQPIQAA